MPVEPRTRRNGQPQACEPCRRSKVRCDHGSPRCARCVLRNLVCIYHPAPLTRRFPSSAQNASIASATHNLASLAEIATRFNRPVNSSPNDELAQSSNESPRSTVSAGLSTRRNAARRDSLFLKDVGPNETTRFSAVFSENQDSFGPVILDAIDGLGPPPPTTNSSHGADVGGSEAATWPLMELAINTLLNFPTARTCDILMTDLSSIHDVWVSPTMIKQCLRQVWTEYGDCLGENRTRDSVSKMAKRLFVNHKESPSPAKYDTDTSFDPPGWMNWFSGSNLQWEMIGILFSWAGMAFRHKQEWDPVFDLPEQHGRNRNVAADKMRECTAACVRLCEDYSEISHIMVICLKNCSKLQSIIISDESKLHGHSYGYNLLLTDLQLARRSYTCRLWYRSQCFPHRRATPPTTP